MSGKKDRFTKSFDIEFYDDHVVIRKKPKRNYFVLIVGVPFTGLLLFFAIGSGIFLLYIFTFLLILLMWRLNFNGFYPTSVLYFRDKVFQKIPTNRHWKVKETRFKDVHAIDFLSKAVSGHTSAYEEGNTDYRNTIVLVTDRGDIRLCSYLNRTTEIEDSVKKFVEILKERLGLAKEFEEK